eukprot:SAG31_NODE_4654_length_3067_cov_2.007075_4_plen_140_part_00
MASTDAFRKLPPTHQPLADCLPVILDKFVLHVEHVCAICNPNFSIKCAVAVGRERVAKNCKHHSSAWCVAHELSLAVVLSTVSGLSMVTVWQNLLSCTSRVRGGKSPKNTRGKQVQLDIQRTMTKMEGHSVAFRMVRWV